MFQSSKFIRSIIVILITAFLLIGCQQSVLEQARDGRLAVVATTSFIGDTIQQIAGDRVNLTVLVEPGQNPHAFQPAPRDLGLAADADLIFANGFNLEGFLDDLLAGAGNQDALVIISQEIIPLEIKQELDDHGKNEEDHEGDHTVDPHVWMNPQNVIAWVEVVVEELSNADPDNADIYRENALSYQAELQELDLWIRKQVAEIPVENRELVTDHNAFGYFTEEYGFQQIGAVIPAPTSEAETSGLQLAELLEKIQEYDVPAIFISFENDSELSRRVAEDAGVDLVSLYLGSLTEGGPADTYLEFMRYDVKKITKALQ